MRLGHLRARAGLVVGEVGEEVVRFAQEQEIDLIVLAWHSRWEGRHAATIKTVLHSAPCPTLVLALSEGE